MSTFHYFGLEPLNARYTQQLTTRWAPEAFRAAARRVKDWGFRSLPTDGSPSEIGAGGVVLDPVGRGVVAMNQARVALQAGDIKDGDVLYFQDMWSPGVEALLYALTLQHKRPRVYARCWAQSVDEYDFTFAMRKWMRHFELGLSRWLSGLFVASTVHRDQLRAAGVDCPIHVTGLPFDWGEVSWRMNHGSSREKTSKTVIFTSRLNAEKNPWFMLEVADEFLKIHPDWRWLVTTSAATWPADVEPIVEAGERLRVKGRNIEFKSGLSKDSYYRELNDAAIQFNCSLQDYVAFTMLEAATANCDLCYPDFRSFTECVHPSRRYWAFDLADALRVLEACVLTPKTHWRRAPMACTNGFRTEMAIMLQDYEGPEVNVWHQPESYFMAAGLL